MTFHDCPKDRRGGARQSADMKGRVSSRQPESNMCDSGPLWDHNDVHRRQSIDIGGGFITAFLTAMHESREEQAAREIRRHRHLARQAEAYVSGLSAQRRNDRARSGVGQIDRAKAQQSKSWASVALRALVSRFHGSKTRAA
jgi:hypothetical protein